MTEGKDTSASFLSRTRQWARTVKREIHGVWLAARDLRAPWYAKWLALAVAANALSPIDLMRDFILVIG